ncbi:MAG: hypothetical protein CM15mP58_11410 [Burkholderiaceae bacterium]|nr:MAG: hypothetical protein CM15mP58_11410 [Burkholderiaceae bacterium]
MCFASLRENLPAFHYMVAVGGERILGVVNMQYLGQKNFADKVVKLWKVEWLV